MATRLNAVGVTVCDFLEGRGVDTSDFVKLGEEFERRGFEEFVGRQANKQNLHNWFRGETPLPKDFGQWFAQAFTPVSEKVRQDIGYANIMRQLPSDYP